MISKSPPPSRLRRTLFRVALWGLVAAALYYLLISGTSIWRSAPIHARVIDAATGQPLAGVIIVANWQLSGQLENYPAGQMAMFEVTTNQSGEFTVPGWGPRWHRGGTVIRGEQPIVRVFLTGYVPQIIDNLPSSGPQNLERADSDMHPRLDGQTVSLTAYHGSPAEYAKLLEPLRASLDFAFTGTRCEWRKTPRIFVEFDRLRREFRSQGIGSNLPLLEHLGGQPACGNASDLLTEHQ